MFTLRRRLEDKLTQSLRNAIDEAQSPLVFGHICCGLLSKAGTFRLTKIMTSETVAPPLHLYHTQTGTTHEEAFRRHIIQFGRSGTLLDWITTWLYNNITRSEEAEASEFFSFSVSATEEAPHISYNNNHVVISSYLFRELVPNSLVSKYLKTIYTSQSGDSSQSNLVRRAEYLVEQMVGSRYSAFLTISSDRESKVALKALGELYSMHHVPASYCGWVFLGALQTGLMFTNVAHNNYQLPIGFVSTGCIYDLFPNEDACKNPLAVISAVAPPAEHDIPTWGGPTHQILNDILMGPIRKDITSVQKCENLPVTDKLAERVGARWRVSEIDRELEKRLPQAFAIHPFPKWTAAIVLWLCMVTETMRYTVHEGQMLDFYFAVADMSQVEDSGLFDIVKLDFPDDAENILPWDEKGMLVKEPQKVFETIQRQINKQNYAWFQEGKYALLWDATFPNKQPQALIRFRDGSWDVFCDDLRIRRPRKATSVIPALAYLRTDGSGGVIVKGNHVLSFRKAQTWIARGGKRDSNLQKNLGRQLGRLNLPQDILKKTCDRIKQVLLAIADDPHAGCALTILSQRVDFPDMGKPWRTSHGNDPLSMTIDEITALMSMDGATCLYVEGNQPKISFRHLITVPDVAERNITEKGKLRLRGQGARKWSAAKAATRDEVIAVIAVSQDGPIYIYEYQTNKGGVTVMTL